MSLSTMFTITFTSTIVFGNVLERLNESETSSGELVSQKRRLQSGPSEFGYYEWPSCVAKGICTVNNGGCPADFLGSDKCHQIPGAVYHVGGNKCYQALDGCMGCLMAQYRDVRRDSVKPVECKKYRWYGTQGGTYHHQLTSPRQFVYKICVRSGIFINGIKFYYKTPKDDEYSAYDYSESPWYGGNRGSMSCFDASGEKTGVIDHVHIWSGGYIDALMFNLKNPRFGNGVRDGNGDVEELIYGGVLRSVELYDGSIYKNNDVINGIKFNWMDDDTANYMFYKMCTTGQISC